MSLSRRQFTAALALAPLWAEAGVKKKAPKSVATVAPVSFTNPSGPIPPHACTKSEIAARVHGDVICDLETGKILYLSDNLSEDKLDTTDIQPASISKLEGVKEIYRRIQAGTWDALREFNVRTRANTPPRPYTLVQNILVSLGPSLNVLDDIAHQAGPDFVASMNAHMRRIGMMHSHYVSPTGNPDNPALYPDVRSAHKSTIGDLLRSIRDFEQNYATPEKTKATLGLERITGIWRVAVEKIHRDRNTISILENAEGEKVHPYKGIRSGKSGLTCASGAISYVRYDDPLTERSFIVLTLGHPTAQARDLHTTKLLDTNMPGLRKFAQDEAAKRAAVPPAPAVLPSLGPATPASGPYAATLK